MKMSISAYHDPRRLQDAWMLINKVCFHEDSLKIPVFVTESPQTLRSRASDFIHDFNLNVDLDQIDGHPAGLCLWDWKRERAVLLVASDIDDSLEFMQVVGHEMVHQALAEKHGFVHMCQIGHGPEFMSYAPKLARIPNLKLVTHF